MNRDYATRPLIAAAAMLLLGIAAPEDAYACRTAIGDFVWADSNGNGIQDDGEPGINGVRVKLFTTDDKYLQGVGILDTITANHPVTGQAGWYTFESVGCIDDYVISIDAVTVPAGYTATLVGAGGDPTRDSSDPNGVVVNFGDEEYWGPPDLTIDFGFVPPCAGAIGDRVWNDANRDGLQDVSELGIAGALVQLNGNPPVATDGNGLYLFGGLCAGTYNVCVQTPADYAISPANQGDDALDSDGISNGAGKSCALVTVTSDEVNLTIDFGFGEPLVRAPGAGTPGYWKNHPEAWPVDTMTIGGITYTREEILPLMTEDPADKTSTIFRALVAAKLNVLIGNQDSCVASTIAAADTWLSTYPLGSNVRASSLAWHLGEPLYRTLDNYNNGMLCAESRD